MTRYHDIESGEIITEKELKAEFEELQKNGNVAAEVTFPEYATNCLTVYGGTLEII